ncbi:MAG: lipid-A-disaccharide synthase [Gemmataceae bacterium]|nr:lipid-A-disaccharide synthase [Gemmata sp.]MDW8199543.1 lipid-A-disaccharide synthase [Gemmataceae bacterium]
MKFFLSAGEPSGDLHGANLIRALLARVPDAHITALGGPRMQAAGAELLYPLTDLAVMWLGQVLRHWPTFVAVGQQALRHIRATRPDAVILIDYPGFHFALAQRLRPYGIPTYFFVPPQIWAWKQGRVRKVRKFFTGVLTALPFEDDWYRRRRVNTYYVGHPYFDELARQQLDPVFLAHQNAQPGLRVALLPGSRTKEVAANGAMLVRAAQLIHAARPDVRFLVAAFNARHADAMRALLPSGVPIEVHTQRTPEIIALADACVAVSGSVSLELMYRAKPTVIVYKLAPLYRFCARQALKVPYITLVNLLANQELYPELLTSRDESPRIAAHILEWLNHPAQRMALVRQLESLRDRVAQPGACDRAAEYLLHAIASPQAPTAG